MILNCGADSVVVPIPPSVNNLYPTGRNGKRYISPEYRKWLEVAIPILRTMKRVRTFPIEVELTVEKKLRSNQDVDNLIKGVIDGSKKAGVIPDDNCQFIVGVVIRYRPVSGGYGVRVQFIPWEPTS